MNPTYKKILKEAIKEFNTINELRNTAIEQMNELATELDAHSLLREDRNGIVYLLEEDK
jgi:hypothetical protein